MREGPGRSRACKPRKKKGHGKKRRGGPSTEKTATVKRSVSVAQAFFFCYFKAARALLSFAKKNETLSFLFITKSEDRERVLVFGTAAGRS